MGMLKRKRVSSAKPKNTRKRATYAVKSSSPTIPRRVGEGNEIYVSLHFASRFSLNAGGGGSGAYQQYRLGSINDPDFTNITGTQPMGHDQYALLFEKYVVYEVQYKVIMTGNSAEYLLATVGVGDASTTTADIDRMIEQGQYEWKVISQTGGGQDVVTFRGTVDMAKAHGVTRQQLLADDSYRAIFNANPAEDQFLNVGVAPLPLTIDATNIDGFIFMTYKCKLMGNILTTRS